MNLFAQSQNLACLFFDQLNLNYCKVNIRKTEPSFFLKKTTTTCEAQGLVVRYLFGGLLSCGHLTKNNNKSI